MRRLFGRRENFLSLIKKLDSKFMDSENRPINSWFKSNYDLRKFQIDFQNTVLTGNEQLKKNFDNIKMNIDDNNSHELLKNQTKLKKIIKYWGSELYAMNSYIRSNEITLSGNMNILLSKFEEEIRCYRTIESSFSHDLKSTKQNLDNDSTMMPSYIESAEKYYNDIKEMETYWN